MRVDYMSCSPLYHQQDIRLIHPRHLCWFKVKAYLRENCITQPEPSWFFFVSGIPEQVSNIKVIWKSLTSVRIACEAPPILDNVDQWGTVYTSLAPPKQANTCNFTLPVARSSQRDLFTAQTVSISWSTAAGDGENASVFTYFPGGEEEHSLMYVCTTQNPHLQF